MTPCFHFLLIELFLILQSEDETLQISVSRSPHWAVTTPAHPVALCCRSEKCKFNLKTVMKLQSPPPPSNIYCGKNSWELKGIWANIMQVCICMAWIVSRWVMVWVNGAEGGEGELACWHFSNRKGWTCCVNETGEAPHPCWLSHSLELRLINPQKLAGTCVFALHTLGCKVHVESSAQVCMSTQFKA